MTTNQQNILDVAERAGATFVQGFLATWAVSNFAMSKVVLVGALMGGLSILWNTSSKIKAALTQPAVEAVEAQATSATVPSSWADSLVTPAAVEAPSPPPITQIPVQ